MKLRKTKTVPSVMALLLAVATGCGSGGNNMGRETARQLFRKSVGMIELYSDSLRQVSDSASLRRMEEAFNDKLTKVNYQFPPNTDLLLTEEENDSLIHLLDSVTALFKIKKIEINRVQADTIPEAKLE